MCPPASPHKGASIVHLRVQCVYFWYGNAAARTFGRARRHRPYGFVWIDCAWMVDFVWVDYAWAVGFVWVDCVQMVILFVWDCVEKYDGVW